MREFFPQKDLPLSLVLLLVFREGPAFGEGFERQAEALLFRFIEIVLLGRATGPGPGSRTEHVLRGRERRIGREERRNDELRRLEVARRVPEAGAFPELGRAGVGVRAKLL